jgi:hypothetical protein
MYDMYPDWGPARHRTDEPEPMTRTGRRPRYWERELVGAGATSAAGDDPGLERPDDN